MQVALTHVLGTRYGDQPVALDALAVTVEAQTPVRTLFVPGRLPCGDCGPCRRGLVDACPRPTAWLHDLGSGAHPGTTVDVPDRFVYDIEPHTTPIQTENGDSPGALWAGLGARVLDAAGRAGLGPGQVAVWIGDHPVARLGAAWSAARGCPTVLCANPDHSDEVADADDKLAVALAAAASGFLERCVFVVGPAVERGGDAGPAPARWMVPGTTVVLMPDPIAPGVLQTPQGPRLVLPSGCKAINAGGHYHPDFVPEAMAALSRGEFPAPADLDTTGVFFTLPAGR